MKPLSNKISNQKLKVTKLKWGRDLFLNPIYVELTLDGLGGIRTPDTVVRSHVL